MRTELKNQWTRRSQCWHVAERAETELRSAINFVIGRAEVYEYILYLQLPSPAVLSFLADISCKASLCCAELEDASPQFVLEHRSSHLPGHAVQASLHPARAVSSMHNVLDIWLTRPIVRDVADWEAH